MLNKYTDSSKIQTYPLGDGVLMCFCRDLVSVQFGGHDGDKVLKHVVSWRELKMSVTTELN